MEEKIKEFIDHYMNTNGAFAQDIRQLIEKLTKNANNGQNKRIVVFSHQMDINSVMNSNTDKRIQRIIIENEENFSDLFEKRLNKKIKDILNGKKIWFCLKYKNLPERLKLKNYKEFKENTNELFSIDCLQIVSMSQALNLVIGSKFVAKTGDESAENQYKWCVKRLRKGFKAKNYKELKDRRLLTQKRQLLAIIETKNGTNKLKPLEMTLFLEIFDESQLQSLYNGSHLESVVLLQINASEYMLLSFDKICRPVPQLIDNFSQFLLQFPENFVQLFNDRKQSTYSLALSLAFIFGDNVSVSGSFFKVKLGLILSLLSLNEYPKKNHSSVLVICDDTPMIQRLFEWTSLINDYRYLLKSLSVPMTGKSREQPKDGLNWIDSGALQLGADGITIIESVANLNELPNKERVALFHALETNEVIAKQSQPSKPSLAELELKSTIWAAIEDNTNERQFQQKTNKSQILWTHVFGMVYRVPKTTDKYNYYPSGSEGTLRLEDWKVIIELMARNRPQMTETAEKLLQKYYVSNRSIWGSKVNHISLQTLISLSKAMAKLSLRLTVTEYDALMAIFLYEESLTALLERASPLAVDPVFHVLVEEMGHFIGPNCDLVMKEFENRLKEFLHKRDNTYNDSITQNEE